MKNLTLVEAAKLHSTKESREKKQIEMFGRILTKEDIDLLHNLPYIDVPGGDLNYTRKSEKE